MFSMNIRYFAIVSTVVICVGAEALEKTSETHVCDNLQVVPFPGEESVCGGITDWQEVEQYDGSLGVSQSFAAKYQGAAVQLQWRDDLNTRYTNQGNVAGVRWCSGTLIARNLVLTAGHCLDVQPNDGREWDFPIDNTTGVEIEPEVAGTEMQINFNYQHSPTGSPSPMLREVSFNVAATLEYREGGLDFAILETQGNPGDMFNIAYFRNSAEVPDGSQLTIFQHPGGTPKKIESGNVTSIGRSWINYGDIDTEGGSSGSGVLDENGFLIGVHVLGGCSVSGGYNSAVSMEAILAESDICRRLEWSPSGDLLFMDPLNNSIHVTLSSGSGFNAPGSGMWISPNGFGSIKENYFPADFNGDGLEDLGYLSGSNAFFVTISTGSSFGGAGSGQWVPVNGFGGSWGKHYTGDFNGDGKDDLLFMEPSNNSIHVGLSTGSGFNAPGSGMWIPPNGFGSIKENYFPADFNGDGLTDLGYLSSSSTFFVTISTGSSFGGAGSGQWISQYQFGGTWGKYYTGDFNGDKKDDLMFMEPNNNTIHVSTSVGTGFFGSDSGQWIGPNGFGNIKENYFVADFNFDGNMDIGYLGSNDGYYVALSTGTAFYGPGSGEWIVPGTWGGSWGEFYVGGFSD
jgi:V8-like Glu-specific endopeptidase